jgi:hypothetical protein
MLILYYCSSSYRWGWIRECNIEWARGWQLALIRTVQIVMSGEESPR